MQKLQKYIVVKQNLPHILTLLFLINIHVPFAHSYFDCEISWDIKAKIIIKIKHLCCLILTLSIIFSVLNPAAGTYYVGACLYSYEKIIQKFVLTFELLNSLDHSRGFE